MHGVNLPCLTALGQQAYDTDGMLLRIKLYEDLTGWSRTTANRVRKLMH